MQSDMIYELLRRILISLGWINIWLFLLFLSDCFGSGIIPY